MRELKYRYLTEVPGLLGRSGSVKQCKKRHFLQWLYLKIKIFQLFEELITVCNPET
jgi:hypothetical protein